MATGVLVLVGISQLQLVQGCSLLELVAFGALVVALKGATLESAHKVFVLGRACLVVILPPFFLSLSSLIHLHLQAAPEDPAIVDSFLD
jgi:hypothetical protein